MKKTYFQLSSEGMPEPHLSSDLNCGMVQAGISFSKRLIISRENMWKEISKIVRGPILNVKVGEHIV